MSVDYQAVSRACPIKTRLASEMRQSVDLLLTLNVREMQAVIDGHFEEAASISAELRVARKQRDATLAEYSNHVETHGC